MLILRRQLRKSYPLPGLEALGEAVYYNRLRLKPEWMPYAVDASGMGEDAFERLLRAERKKWSVQKMVDIINREFGLEGKNLCQRIHIRWLEATHESMRSPNHTLLHYIGSLEIVQTVDGKKYYSSFGLDLIAQGLIRWQTGDYLSETAKEQVLAQQNAAAIQQWLKPVAQVQ